MSASTITPKQQSFVRSLAEERLPTLAIQYKTDFKSVDDWLAMADITTLTGNGASKLIDALDEVAQGTKG